VQYSVLKSWFSVDYLCVLFVGDGVKLRTRRIETGNVYKRNQWELAVQKLM
jgi:hypothetical protein